MLSPDGKDWLTNAGRGPQHALGEDPAVVVTAMNRIANRYEPQGDLSQSGLQDFHSFRQALNVASADQRVLLLIAGTEEELASQQERLRPLGAHSDLIGRFHTDQETTTAWREPLGASDSQESGFYLIHSGEFGLKGEIVAELPLDAPLPELIAAMDQARTAYASGTEKKVYRDHVAKGRKVGAYFESAVPYGEDRDGDGEIDHRGGGKGKGKGKDR
ncbi:MAG: hypothetical protein AAGJ31_02290 [Verrucomicrobiota bacterium]